jgi:hypothetical protein
VGRPLCQEVGSIVYNCCLVSPAQSFSGPSPTGPMPLFYFLKYETRPVWSASFLYLFPPVDVAVILRPTVSWPFCLGIGHPRRIHDQTLISVGHSRFSSCRTPSLEGERVCNFPLKLLLGLASAVSLGYKSRRTRHISYSVIWDWVPVSSSATCRATVEVF